MKNYAVLRIRGKQYKVSEGDKILIQGKPSKEYGPEVLLVVADKKVVVGMPVISGAKLKIKDLQEEVKGEKLHVFKYKAKSRYRKKIGFRSTSVRLQVEKIG
jgi:large subunit ribosomal protein L21